MFVSVAKLGVVSLTFRELSKIISRKYKYSARNHINDNDFKLKLCMCDQSMALGTRT